MPAAAFFVAGDLNLDTTTIVPAPARSGKETQARIGLSFGGQGGNVAFFLRCLGEPVRLFGMLRLPASLFEGVRCREFEPEEGRYGFDVEARLPLVGRVIRYQGWLEPA